MSKPVAAAMKQNNATSGRGSNTSYVTNKKVSLACYARPVYIIFNT